jgi:hypothetical protein
VDNGREGKNTSIPDDFPRASNAARNALFAATPPETKTLSAEMLSAADMVRSSKSRTTASWNSRIKAKVCGEQSGSSCS